MSEWISVDERLPEPGDYSVLAYSQAGAPDGWPEGGMDMVHAEFYFNDITCGLDDDGNQLYTKWHISQGVTHWMPLPDPPK